MNKGVLICPVIAVVCFVLCGCGNSSKQGLILSESPDIPPSRTLTLSQQQLVFLDWHSPNLPGARVMRKRVVPGSGVEFDIYFPSNAPGYRSVNYVSSGEGGIGALVGVDIRDYEAFALAFTLVSINGQTTPELKEKVEVGALIGPTATGKRSDSKPVALSLLSSEKSTIAKTPMRTNRIYQIGFYVRMLNPQNWNPTGTKMILRVEPVEDAGFVPLKR